MHQIDSFAAIARLLVPADSSDIVKGMTITCFFPSARHLTFPIPFRSIEVEGDAIMRIQLRMPDSECFHLTRINLGSAKCIPRTSTQKDFHQTLFACALEWNLAPACSFGKLLMGLNMSIANCATASLSTASIRSMPRSTYGLWPFSDSFQALN